MWRERVLGMSEGIKKKWENFPEENYTKKNNTK